MSAAGILRAGRGPPFRMVSAMMKQAAFRLSARVAWANVSVALMMTVCQFGGSLVLAFPQVVICDTFSQSRSNCYCELWGPFYGTSLLTGVGSSFRCAERFGFCHRCVLTAGHKDRKSV